MEAAAIPETFLRAARGWRNPARAWRVIRHRDDRDPARQGLLRTASSPQPDRRENAPPASNLVPMLLLTTRMKIFVAETNAATGERGADVTQLNPGHGATTWPVLFITASSFDRRQAFGPNTASLQSPPRYTDQNLGPLLAGAFCLWSLQFCTCAGLTRASMLTKGGRPAPLKEQRHTGRMPQY